MPEDTVYVGRPSKWGNWHTFKDIDWETNDPNQTLVDLFEESVLIMFKTDDELHEWLAPLRGKDLACWCPLDRPCHADVLLKLANAEVKP